MQIFYVVVSARSNVCYARTCNTSRATSDIPRDPQIRLTMRPANLVYSSVRNTVHANSDGLITVVRDQSQKRTLEY